jgi:hypothetical protein
MEATMAASKLPDIDFVRECLAYDPDTGVFTWRERPIEHFTNARGHWQWNGRYPGTPAGSEKGRSRSRNYIGIRLNGELFNAHRLAWLLHYGIDPWPLEIDHIDGDALNNRIGNLRLATRSQNTSNRRFAGDTQTGVKGVTVHRNGYIACVKANGKRYYLGKFRTVAEAAKAYQEASKRLHGEFHS